MVEESMRLDPKTIRIERGIYLSRDVVDVGDAVLVGGRRGVIRAITQANYLPRFLVEFPDRSRWVGKTKLRYKVAAQDGEDEG